MHVRTHVHPKDLFLAKQDSIGGCYCRNQKGMQCIDGSLRSGMPVRRKQTQRDVYCVLIVGQKLAAWIVRILDRLSILLCNLTIELYK